MNDALINKVLNPPDGGPGAWLSDLAALFLPRRCAGCDTALMRFEPGLCLGCLSDLPQTRFHEDPDNPVEQLFRGKVPLASASAFLYFYRSGSVQHMLHRLKYKHDRDIGLLLGRMMGEVLKTSPRFATVDTLVAVPLHPRKERARGYNQSQVIIDGMLRTWPLAAPRHALVRTTATRSQTRKGRLERWLNVKEVFTVRDHTELAGRHVLLVDDVVTTGSTLEACALALLALPGTRVSVFTAACA
jgi:ComF family protein